MSQTSQLVELTEQAAASNKLLDEISSHPVFVQLDSTILTLEQSAILRGWYGSGVQSWSLLYRGSRDGMEVSKFHQLCDDKGPTVTVIKTSEGFVFGGHAAKSWANPKYIRFLYCTDSSLFTLLNPHGIKPTIFRISSDFQNALRCHELNGPTFGRCDLHTGSLHTGSPTIGSGAYTEFGGTYQDTTGKGSNLFTGQRYFQIEEIEVFKVDNNP